MKRNEYKQILEKREKEVREFMGDGKEEMGIIEYGGVGLRDAGYPIFWFTIKRGSGGAALQIESLEIMAALIYAYELHDIKDIHRKPIWVLKSGMSLKWLRPCLI